MTLNTPNDIIKLLKQKRIKPMNAVRLYSFMRNLMQLEFTDTIEPTVEEVIAQIEILETLNNPIIFWQQENDFAMKDLFKINLN
jgi:hypothetical protein